MQTYNNVWMKYVSFTLVSYLLVSTTKYWSIAKNLVPVLKGVIENPEVIEDPDKRRKTDFCKKVKI